MSTKTTFKRVALVAVAALGLGVLSVVPSQASPVSGLTVTTTNGTATTMNSDSTTAAKIKIQFLALAGASDSVTVAVVSAAQVPTDAVIPQPRMMFSESTTSVAGVYAKVDSSAINANLELAAKEAKIGAQFNATTLKMSGGSTANGTYSTTIKYWLGETSTASQVTKAGTYSFNAIVTSQGTNANEAPTVTVHPFTIVVSAAAVESTLVNTAYTDVFLGSNTTGAATSDATPISALATASATPAGTLTINLRNALNAAVAQDTVTVTVTGPGLVNDGTTSGKSLSGYKTGTVNYTVLPDGNAGVTTLTITTAKAGVSATKTLSFYAKAATTVTASVYNPVLAVGANSSAVAVKAVDSNGNAWTGSLYVVASSAADALIVGAADPVACSNALLATTGYIFCPITAVTVGTGKVKVIDSADTAVTPATATSNEVTLTVKPQTAATVKIAFDKASYAPNEKAFITVTPLDASGAAVQGKVWTNLLATGGITSTSAFASGSMDSLTAVSHTTSSSTGTSTTAGSYTFTVYMPAASGDVTISATGGTALPAAGQVKVTATAAVVNSSVDAATDAANEATDAANAATDAALAAADAADAATAAAQDASDAVAALSASVSKLISSLRAQITSLTNLVIKIQKKVRA
jgi:trimeric autotransporter adhesin